LQKRAKGADQTEKGTTAKTNLTAGQSQKRRDEKTEELDGENDSQQTRRDEETGRGTCNRVRLRKHHPSMLESDRDSSLETFADSHHHSHA
jgi:hypothetical protein